MSAVETRHTNRDSMFLMAGLATEGQAEPVRVRVRNLSPTGMMAEGEFEIERGARVTIELRNIGKVKGSVAWVHAERIGIAFDEEIEPRMVRAKIEHKGSEVPVYARPAVDAPKYDDPNRKFRPI